MTTFYFWTIKIFVDDHYLYSLFPENSPCYQASHAKATTSYTIGSMKPNLRNTILNMAANSYSWQLVSYSKSNLSSGMFQKSFWCGLSTKKHCYLFSVTQKRKTIVLECRGTDGICWNCTNTKSFSEIKSQHCFSIHVKNWYNFAQTSAEQLICLSEDSFDLLIVRTSLTMCII